MAHNLYSFVYKLLTLKSKIYFILIYENKRLNRSFIDLQCETGNLKMPKKTIDPKVEAILHRIGAHQVSEFQRRIE